MKNFFSSFLGALVALVLFFGGCAFLALVVLLALATLGQKQAASVERGSYLVFDLSANIQDAPPPFDNPFLMSPLFGGGRQDTLQLRSVTRALRAAAKDPRIAGLYLTGSLLPNGYGSGFGALKEVRAALLDFKASGKPMLAYFDFATTRDYYLASAAGDVVLDPYGLILMPGLASHPLFFAGAFEKFGIGVQVTRVGKYKSAIEPYTRKDLSPENREQLEKLLGDIWGDLLAEIGASRQLAPAALQRTVDREGLIKASDAIAAKFVNRTAYRDEILDELKARTGRGRGAHETFKQIGLGAYAGQLPGAGGDDGGVLEGRHNWIAVVYAEGDIVDGDGEIGDVGGDRFARELRRLRQDDSVKAIVLRVNSPGGSATASEEIQRELRLTMRSKPVVVSMGTVAASGGYWISTYSDRIFAEPATITGSIGVYGMFLNVQQLATNLGFTWDTVKTGKLADMLTISRPKTDEELVVFQRLVDWIYEEFTAKVAEGRKLDKSKVLEIAQGRVWSGAEAKRLGLVDEMGGLQDALAYAAKKADLGRNYRVTEYPRKRQLAELINEILREVAPDQSQSHAALLTLVRPYEDQLHALLRLNDPRGLYARLPEDLVVQ